MGIMKDWFGLVPEETVNLAEKTPKPKNDILPPMRELGAPGTIFMRGNMVYEDLNTDWANLQKRAKLVNEMRKTDGQVQAVLLACKLPILASNWIVRAPEDATKEQQDIADFVSKNLNQMSNPWSETLSQILTYLDFGFSVFEVIYEVGEDGKFHWKKWAPRHQTTITKWNAESDGGLRSVTQSVWKENGYKDVELGIERLLIFTNFKEAANWEGVSILRPAYKHYYIKDKLYRIDAIAHERNGVGLPVIKVPDGAGKDEMDIAEQILIDMRTHEKGYVVEPQGFELRILAIPGQPRNILDSIKHHNEEISRVVLANFLQLGFSTSGSRALGQSMADFFLASLNTYTSYIAGIINRHAVKQLVDVNFGTQEKYPELKAIPVAGIDFERMAKSLMVLAQTGLIVPDAKTVDHISTIMGLPRPDPAEVERMQAMRTQMGTQGLKGNAQNGNRSTTQPQKAEEKKPSSNGKAKQVSESVRGVIQLQVSALEQKVSTTQAGGKIQPVMEGTLARAMVLSLDGDGFDHSVIEDAAFEFSRRLAVAAKMGLSSGGPEKAKEWIDQEVVRSTPLLVEAMSTKKLGDEKGDGLSKEVGA